MANLLQRVLGWRHLPIVLIASMVVIGVCLEAVVFGSVEWLAKLPLIGLLGLYGWRDPRRRRSGSSGR